ncbi:hypothetical protein N1851_030788 [Merluccius polli]|uniref:Uncharacterized protein n=1 Tax=Merluccius polli TaxID=89951 RepID=A0AA47NPS9_MERPO|nr:hypothetical protein N1851_030788 [Merluccius polli]
MPQLFLHAAHIMSVFGSTYSCEEIFPVIKLNKISHNTDQHLVSVLKVATAKDIKPGIDEVITKKRCRFSACAALQCLSKAAVLPSCNHGSRGSLEAGGDWKHRVTLALLKCFRAWAKLSVKPVLNANMTPRIAPLGTSTSLFDKPLVSFHLHASVQPSSGQSLISLTQPPLDQLTVHVDGDDGALDGDAQLVPLAVEERVEVAALKGVVEGVLLEPLEGELHHPLGAIHNY